MDYLEHKTYELTCISPVHIGSGETLKKYEYLYDNKKNVVYFPDKTQWITLLQKYNLFEEYLEYVNNPEQLTRMNSYAWLNQHKVSERDIIATASRKAMAPKNIAESKGGRNTKGNINDIVTAISLAGGSLYIPGSSIKGVLHTGILYHQLKTHPNILKDIEERMEQMIRQSSNKRDIEKKAKDIDKEIEKKLLGLLKIDDVRDDSPLKSVMRGLMVSDAVPVRKMDSVIVQKLDGVLDKDGRGVVTKPLPIVRECIPSDSKLRVQISFDKRMMAELGIKSIDEIFAYALEYTKAGLNELKIAFNRNKSDKFYTALFQEAEGADFFLGGGTGFLSKTIWVALFANKRTDMIRSLLGIITPPKHNHKTRDRFISPRTLKMSEVDGDYRLMGMCQLKELK